MGCIPFLPGERENDANKRSKKREEEKKKEKKRQAKQADLARSAACELNSCGGSSIGLPRISSSVSFQQSASASSTSSLSGRGNGGDRYDSTTTSVCSFAAHPFRCCPPRTPADRGKHSWTLARRATNSHDRTPRR
ncbi:Hypothetical protein NTJ_07571 [Nesidiocoris tenuis]|uniref:Uncharacterized protein n=1 Tax=Nesidiocoris tenuis TaxID=355587 RepID=A0ABN7AWC6_9HEMI|nr:Hypothetical protein NTJ_07571 [Nesidiocoris tenuis]